MNLYLDSSALVKRYVDEEGSAEVRKATNQAQTWNAAHVGLVETMLAVGRKAGKAAEKRARDEWDRSMNVIYLDQSQCDRALELARRRNLGTLDALHLAAALRAAHRDLTFATFDRRLHAAAQAEGLATLPASLS